MKLLSITCFLALLMGACSSPADQQEKETHEKPLKPFASMERLVTRGLPKGFIQRDYTLSQDGKVAYTTIQLPSGKRSFIVQVDLANRLPVLASFSGKFNDLEPMFAPGDSVLLFASDRPLFKGDTTRDYNLWKVSVNGLKVGDPQPFDTIINTEWDEYYPSMSSDGSLYFTAIYPGHRRDDLYRSLKTDSGYTRPEMLSFCQDNDLYEFNSYIFPGGDTLLFTSGGREDEVGGGDLYITYRDTAGIWANPLILANDVNTGGLDFSPFVKNDTLYLTSRRQDKSWETKKFSYLAEITSYADSSVIGEQSVYFTRLSRLFEVKENKED